MRTIMHVKPYVVLIKRGAWTRAVCCPPQWQQATLALVTSTQNIATATNFRLPVDASSLLMSSHQQEGVTAATGFANQETRALMLLRITQPMSSQKVGLHFIPI